MDFIPATAAESSESSSSPDIRFPALSLAVLDLAWLSFAGLALMAGVMRSVHQDRSVYVMMTLGASVVVGVVVA